jgi:hypothetical protein
MLCRSSGGRDVNIECAMGPSLVVPFDRLAVKFTSRPVYTRVMAVPDGVS